MTPLELEYIDGRSWKVTKEFDYLVDFEDPGSAIRVPAGFITDFASIPRAFWSFMIPTGRYGKAAVIHDYLYVVGGKVPCICSMGYNDPSGYRSDCPLCRIFTKDQVDRIFRDAMEVLGVGNPQRWIMWQAVRRFGKGNFGKV
jgi:hypothetical protein